MKWRSSHIKKQMSVSIQISCVSDKGEKETSFEVTHSFIEVPVERDSSTVHVLKEKYIKF